MDPLGNWFAFVSFCVVQYSGDGRYHSRSDIAATTDPVVADEEMFLIEKRNNK